MIRKRRDTTTPLRFNWYKNFLEKAVEKRNLVILLSVILLGIAALMVPHLGSEFMPKSESAEFTLNLKLPEGTSLLRTSNTIYKTEGIIRELLGDKIKTLYSQAGADNTSSLNTGVNKGENTGSVKIVLAPAFASETEAAISLIGNYMKTIPDIESGFTQGRNCSPVVTRNQ